MNNDQQKKIIKALAKDNHILCQQRNGMLEIIGHFVNKGASDLKTILKVFCKIANAQSGLLLTLPVEQREKELFDAVDLKYSASVESDIPELTKEIPILKYQFSGPIALLKTAPLNEGKQIKIDECMKIWNPQMTSYLWLPIVIGKRFFGVVILFKTSNESVFSSEDDIKLFSSMTEQTGLLIQYMISENTKTELLISEKEKTERLIKSEKEKEELNELIATSIEDRIPYKYGHTERIEKLCGAIGENLGLEQDELRELKIAAMLHDVGKRDFSDTLLSKPVLAGSVWTEKEETEYKNHPVKGVDIIKEKLYLSKKIKEGILHHHEHYNGQGYPDELHGAEIPRIASIIGIACDFDDAMCRYRYNYAVRDRKKKYSILALEEMKSEGICERYAPDVLEALEKSVMTFDDPCWENKKDKMLEEAYHEYSNKHVDRAINICYQILMDTDKANIMYCMAAAQIVKMTGHRRKAINFYDRIIQANPTLAEAYYRRGRCYDKEGHLDKAGMDFAVAITICPTYLEAHLRLGQIRYRLGKYRKAIESFDTVIEEEPSNALAFMEKGRILSNMCYLPEDENGKKEQLKKAEANLEKALEKIKDEESSEKARRLNQNTYIEDELHYLLAEVYEQQGEHEAAEKERKIISNGKKETVVYKKVESYYKSIEEKAKEAQNNEQIEKKCR